jgi:acyl carrier protein
MDTLATVDALQSLIENLLGEPVSQPVRRDTRFVQDLGLASLHLIGLVYLCEQTFNVSLVSRAGLLATLHTVGETVDAIVTLQRESSSSAVAETESVSVAS